MNQRISVHVATKDRHSEIALLLDSLRKQTYQNWDLVLLDDGSGTPLFAHHPSVCLFNRLRLEGHYIKLLRNNSSYGVCSARQRLIDNDDFGNTLTLRLDDDIILEKDYIERLVNVINKGYDMASGVVPHMNHPLIKRDTKFVKPIINKLEFDDQGNITAFGDDCGYAYLESEILPAHHFRTNLLYKSEINKKVSYEKCLSPVGFREETFFGLRAYWEGYTMAVDTGAITFHFQTPSGGCRHANYAQLVHDDDIIFRMWFKMQFLKRGSPFKKLLGGN